MPKSKRIKVIIDTNLFISFLIGKKLKRLKEFLIDSRIELVFAEQNIQELRIVCQRAKFNNYFKADKLDDLIDLIYVIGQVFKIDDVPNICRDPKDNFLLQLALKGRADFLITGDKDLLSLSAFMGTKIVTLKEFESTLKDDKT